MAGVGVSSGKLRATREEVRAIVRLRQANPAAYRQVIADLKKAQAQGLADVGDLGFVSSLVSAAVGSVQKRRAKKKAKKAAKKQAAADQKQEAADAAAAREAQAAQASASAGRDWMKPVAIGGGILAGVVLLAKVLEPRPVVRAA